MCLELMRGMMRGVRICYFIEGYETFFFFFFFFLRGEDFFFSFFFFLFTLEGI
jgi:hypothetical protein